MVSSGRTSGCPLVQPFIFWAEAKGIDRRRRVFCSKNTSPPSTGFRRAVAVRGFGNGRRAMPKTRWARGAGRGNLFCRNLRHNFFSHCRGLNFPFCYRSKNFPLSPFVLPFCNNFRCYRKQKRCLSVPPQKQASTQLVAIWKSKVSYLSKTFSCLILFSAALPPFFGRRSRPKNNLFYIFIY